jgi:protein-S-isoprenylcysteine O-methyltransferase Ste14
MMKNKRILPPTYLLASIIAMLILHFLLPLVRIVLVPWNFIGILILIAGAVANVLADNIFHRVGTTVKPYEESATLVRTGPYEISRNPMYLGFVLILLGLAIFLGSLAPFLVVGLFIVLMDNEFIKFEEEMLAKKFGAEWREYMGKVRRWI